MRRRQHAALALGVIGALLLAGGVALEGSRERAGLARSAAAGPSPGVTRAARAAGTETEPEPAWLHAAAAARSTPAPLAGPSRSRSFHEPLRHALAGAQQPPRIDLEAVAVAPGEVTGTVSGHDAGAPRALELWRVASPAPERLAVARSDTGGRILAPQVPIPAGGAVLVVTPVGVAPGEAGASDPRPLHRENEEVSR